MKPIEEMSEREIADWFFGAKAVTDTLQRDYDVALHRLCLFALEHPAQRIADWTGCVITRDYNRSYCLWTIGINLEDLHLTGNEWREKNNLEPYKIRSKDLFVIIDLPDDGRPWQESIYRPRTK